MILEPVRMSTYEPFSIKKPFDKIKDIGGGIVDKGKDIGGGIANVGKDIGKGAANIGKKVGGAVVDFGKGVGKVLGPIFKGIFSFLMSILKNWKLALFLAIACCLCYLTAPVWMAVTRFF
jgi:hypothetical protein